MEDTGKISLGQLMTLMLLSRMFTAVTYTPEGQEMLGGLSLVGTFVSGVVQVAVLTVGIRLSRSATGVSPMIMGSCSKTVYRVLGVCYWALAMGVCLYTAISFTYFVVSNFYDFTYWWVVVLVLIFAAGLGVRQGLEAVSRSAAVMGVFLLGFFGLLVVGLLPEFELLNFTWSGMTTGQHALAAYRNFAMNFELVAFLLLLPWVRDYQPPRGRRWVVWSTVLSMGLQLILQLAVGSYARGKRFPYFAMVSSTQFAGLSRLDSLFMGVWVVLGFYKMAVFLQLAVSLWAAVGYRPVRHRDIWIHCGFTAGLALAALGLGGLYTALYAAAAAGVLTTLGVLVLPGISRLVRWKEERQREKKSG